MLSSETTDCLARARDASSLLDGPAAEDARHLVTLSNEALLTPSIEADRILELKLELGRLVEVVARRDAKAMPFAALGRAALARLFGSQGQSAELLLEFENKLTVLGL